MKRFEYLAPTSLEQALEMLAARPEAIPLAGGTDLLVQMKERQRPVAALLSLKRLPELHAIRQNGELFLGAAATAGSVARQPRIQQDFTALAAGSGLIGSIQIRNIATVGGNLCNASPSADAAPPLLVLGAQALIAGLDGERSLDLEAFFLGPGRTALQPGELLVGIRLPAPPERSGSFYYRHTPRAWMDIAFVGVAAAVTLDDKGRISHARLALGAVAPVPMRARQAEGLLSGNSPSEELFEAAGQLAAAESQPIDDLRASAAYRRHLVGVLTRRALRQTIARAKEDHGVFA